jgi:hypothetical protein
MKISDPVLPRSLYYCLVEVGGVAIPMDSLVLSSLLVELFILCQEVVVLLSELGLEIEVLLLWRLGLLLE